MTASSDRNRTSDECLDQMTQRRREWARAETGTVPGSYSSVELKYAKWSTSSDVLASRSNVTPSRTCLPSSSIESMSRSWVLVLSRDEFWFVRTNVVMPSLGVLASRVKLM